MLLILTVAFQTENYNAKLVYSNISTAHLNKLPRKNPSTSKSNAWNKPNAASPKSVMSFYSHLGVSKAVFRVFEWTTRSWRTSLAQIWVVGLVPTQT